MTADEYDIVVGDGGENPFAPLAISSADFDADGDRAPVGGRVGDDRRGRVSSSEAEATVHD